MLGLTLLGMVVGCQDPSKSSVSKQPTTPSISCALVSTATNKPLNLTMKPSDTEEVKAFYRTCENPYASASPDVKQKIILAGQILFKSKNCSQCHGSDGQGATAKGIKGPTWVYDKNSTDKGLFETIAGGTSKGDVPHHLDLTKSASSLTSDEILQLMLWIREPS